MERGGYSYHQYYSSANQPQPNYSDTRSLPNPSSSPQYQQPVAAPEHSRPTSHSPHTLQRHNQASAYSSPQRGSGQGQPGQYTAPSNTQTVQPQYRVRSPQSSSWQHNQNSYAQWTSTHTNQPQSLPQSYYSNASQSSNYQPFSQHTSFTPSNPQSHSRSDYAANRDHFDRSSPFRGRLDNSQPATVDPSAVYDASHEIRRQQALIEAARQAREAQAAEQARKAEEEKRVEEAKKAKEARKAEKAKAAELKKKSHNMPGQQRAPTDQGIDPVNVPASGAGKATQAATSTDVPQDSCSANAPEEMEVEIRRMFQKMREFNSKNPDLLSQLWQQERDEYVKQNNISTSSAAQDSQPPQQPPPSSSSPQTNRTSKAKQEPRKSNRPPRPPKPVRVETWSPEDQQSSNTAASIAAFGLPSPVNKYKSNPGLSNNVTPPANKATSGDGSVASSVSHSSFVLPEDNKFRVALTVSELLKQSFDGKTIPVEEIMTLLTSNPSYIDFCQQLEARGISLNRSQFARALMNTIPSLRSRSDRLTVTQSQNSAAEPATTQSPNLTSSSAAKAKGASEGLSTAARATSNAKGTMSKSHKKKILTNAAAAGVNGNIDPSLEGLDAIKQFVDGTSTAQTHSANKNQAKEHKSRKPSKTQSKASSTPHPPTKSDLARKRSFGELVDLTQPGDSSDDETILFVPQATANGTHMPTPPQTSPENLQTVDGPNDHSEKPSTTFPVPDTAAQPQSKKLILAAPEHPHRSNQSIIKPIDKYKAIRRSAYDPKTIARDVLLACGRHPHMRHLNAHLESLKSAFPAVTNDSDLGTFRWDIADPGGPKVGANSAVVPAESIVADPIDADDEGSDHEELGRTHIATAQAARQAVGAMGGVSVESAPQRTPRIKSSKKGIRQRGPGSAQSGGTPQLSSSSAPPGNSYREIRERLEAEARARGETYVPKRGRPPGWRKSMMSTPGVYGHGSATRKPSKPSPEPVYQVYKCEWKGCNAELHNLATLRKHVFKLHSKLGETGKYPCLWHDCGKAQQVVDHTTNRVSSKFVTAEFPSKETWKDHVEKRHLQPIAWELGDGPKGGVSDNYESEVSETYASDSQGRRVTPRVVVSPQSARQEPKRSSQLDREAEMEKQAEQNRKRDIGPGMDRQGATLANDERRRGFIDDADVMEIVDDDE